MKITVISAWYNESLLAPYFFSHYDSFVSEYHILLDTDTTDCTRDLLVNRSNVTIHDITYPNGFDDTIKIAAINALYKTFTGGWVLCVDSDEFVFSLFRNIPEFLEGLNPDWNVLKSDMYHPYRHVTDDDLNLEDAVIYQRRHGSLTNEHGDSYNKPCLVKAGLPVEWSVGQHILYGTHNCCPIALMGVHWCYADPSIALARHTKNRKDRLSPENIAAGMSLHFQKHTEEFVLQRCKEHENDPRLF